MAKNDPLWFTKAHAATLSGLSVRQFGDAIQPLLDAAAVKGKGAKLRFHGPAVVSACVRRRESQLKPPEIEADPLLGGGGDESDALERYRLVSAKLKEHELAEKQGHLLRTQVIVESLRPATSAFRDGADRVRRTFGNEAGDAVNEMVDEFGAAVLRSIEDLGQKYAVANDGRNDVGQAADQRDEVAKVQKPPRVRRRGNHPPYRAVRRKKVSG